MTAREPEDRPATLGIDGGGTSGLLLASWKPGARRPVLVRTWQCDMDGTPELLEWILGRYDCVLGAVQIEEFDARERSRKLRGFSASGMHKLNSELTGICMRAGLRVFLRPPAKAKTWATDKRLAAAGLLEATAGMPDHARDGGRHALYTAVHDCGLRDPLSRKAS